MDLFTLHLKKHEIASVVHVLLSLVLEFLFEVRYSHCFQAEVFTWVVKRNWHVFLTPGSINSRLACHLTYYDKTFWSLLS